jgi:hypothetical protein
MGIITPSLKQRYKRLESFLLLPLYSNGCRALESIFRRCQRSSVSFRDNEQGLFPGPNRLCQKHQEHPVRFGTGRSFHLSSEDNKLLAQERVFCHEFGLASGKVCQRPQ